MPLRRIVGRFYRAIVAQRVDQVLAVPAPDGAARYHRPGQAALYITPEPDWAAIAVGQYMARDGLPRLIVPLDLDGAMVFDQHDVRACQALGIDPDASNLGWQQAMARGEEPPSWRASDAARAAGADGIIDRSRGIVGGWHVTLFHWNRPGAPAVSVAGDGIVADYAAARDRWPSPPGWTLL